MIVEIERLDNGNALVYKDNILIARYRADLPEALQDLEFSLAGRVSETLIPIIVKKMVNDV